MEFIKAYGGTILVAAVVLAVVIAVIIKIIKDKKSGKTGIFKRTQKAL